MPDTSPRTTRSAHPSRFDPTCPLAVQCPDSCVVCCHRRGDRRTGQHDGTEGDLSHHLQVNPEGVPHEDVVVLFFLHEVRGGTRHKDLRQCPGSALTKLIRSFKSLHRPNCAAIAHNRSKGQKSRWRTCSTKPDKTSDTSDGSMVSTLQMCHWTDASRTGWFPLSTVRQQTTVDTCRGWKTLAREVSKFLRKRQCFLQTVHLFERRTLDPHNRAQ